MSCGVKNLWLSPFKKIRLFSYGTVDSTNSLAKRYAAENSADAVFVARGQTAGRGRLGRSFSSELGCGLYMSILIHPKGCAANSLKLTALAGVAVCRAIEKNTALSPQIKWVNDIQLGGKKVAGILAEGELDAGGKLKYAVIGIGLNLYKRDFGTLSDIAASLEDFGVTPPAPERILRDIVGEFFAVCSREELSRELEYYRRHSSVIGRSVTVYKGGGSYPARAVDITGNFELIVTDGRGESVLSSAEVSVRTDEQTDLPKSSVGTG